MAATCRGVGAATAVSAAVVDERATAGVQGCKGDACGECGTSTLLRNGACLTGNTGQHLPPPGQVFGPQARCRAETERA